MKSGCGIHMYACTKDMGDKCMYNSDGDFLIVPQLGRLQIRTEMGTIDVEPCEIVVIQARRRRRPSLPWAALLTPFPPALLSGASSSPCLSPTARPAGTSWSCSRAISGCRTSVPSVCCPAFCNPPRAMQR